MIGDAWRDAIFIAAGYQTIRIPYFVQLTEPVISQLFGDLVADRSTFKEFPHGFIASTVVFPADFCELGIGRFRVDLERFAVIKPDIVASLARSAKAKCDWQLVYPPSLYQSLGKPSGY